MVKELILYCKLEHVEHDKMWFLIALFLESGKFRCSFTLVIKCWKDIPMYVKFVSHEQKLLAISTVWILKCFTSLPKLYRNLIHKI